VRPGSGRPLVGVLGAGRHAVQGHIAPLRALGAPVLAWDPDPAALARVQAPGVRAGVSEDDVLSGCDVLVVCSPDRFHTAALVAAVERGLPVLIEKPVCVSAADLDRARPLLAGDPATSTPVLSCHPRRTDPPFAGLRALLPGLVAELGPVTSAEFRFDYPPPRAGQPQLHASLLTDHVGHELDLLDFLFGAPERVEGADVLPAGADPQLEYAVEGERSDGIGFRFSGARTDPAQAGYDEVLTVRFAGGRATAGSRSGSAGVSAGGRTRPLDLGGTDYEARFRAVNANLLDVVAGSAPPYVSAGQIWRNTVAAVDLDRAGRFTLERDGRVNA
jgi:predicted dehydrogenase